MLRQQSTTLIPAKSLINSILHIALPLVANGRGGFIRKDAVGVVVGGYVREGAKEAFNPGFDRGAAKVGCPVAVVEGAVQGVPVWVHGCEVDVFDCVGIFLVEC